MNNTKKYIIIGLIIVFSIIVLIYEVLPKNNKYNEAISYMDQGRIDEAYTILKSLNLYRSANHLCDEIDLSRAKASLEKENLKDAYIQLSRASSSKEAIQLKEELETEHPYLTILNSQDGDIVTFGKYEQDGDISNGKEPIEWIVLKNQDGNIYMLSRYLLDFQPFNSKNTNDCLLEKWLNTTFRKNAFEEIHESVITQISLLHRSEISKYSFALDDYMSTDFTEYAYSMISNKAESKYWWVYNESLSYDTYRSGFLTILMPAKASYNVRAFYVTDKLGVRPTVCLFADKGIYPEKPDYKHIDAEIISTAPADLSQIGKKKKEYDCSWCGGDGKTHDWNWDDEGSTCSHCGGDGRIGEDD